MTGPDGSAAEVHAPETHAIKKLDDQQVEAFDTEYVDDARWAPISSFINRDFPDGRFSFLDVGGGNGVFADRLLAEYPNATGMVLDNSAVLLSRNAPNPRKATLCTSAENVATLNHKFDLISINWVLHHLVGHSYRESRQHQLSTLQALRGLLTERGRLSIYENNYLGWVFRDLPGRMIYELTSSKLLSPVVGKMGANTAGVGVCFLSQRQWFDTVGKAGFRLLEFTEPDRLTWPLRFVWKAGLHLRSIRVGHYWLARA
jgi:hypothetical protein